MIKDKPFVVVDNYFSPIEYTLIKNRVETSDLTFIPHISGLPTESKDILNDSGFVNTWYSPEGLYQDGSSRNEHPVITELLHLKLSQDFDVSNMLRVRLGVFIPSGAELQVHDPHVDFAFPHYTALLYTCTEKGGGYTYLWNEFFDPYTYKSVEDQVVKLGDRLSLDKATRVEPRENRVIVFRGDMFHASSLPKSIIRRTAVNINFEGTPKDGKT